MPRKEDSFYRPKKWNTADVARVREVREYLNNREFFKERMQLGSFFSFSSGYTGVEKTSIETQAYLTALGCKPYKITPTQEESEILYLEDLFNQEAKPNEQISESKIPTSSVTSGKERQRHSSLGSKRTRRRDG